MSEADTCRKLVVPKLLAGGWDTDPHSIAEQRSITDGRIVPVGKGFIRKPPKRVDFLLRYTRDFPLAVVEAKASYKAAADGMQQAKTYAEMLGLKFAYATNGHDVIEFDYLTGIESTVSSYPTPDELWQRYRKGRGLSDNTRAERLLTPSNHAVGKGERYYQQIAINRTMEAILNGDRRLLLTMATGTGKTMVAFQICWKLWTAAGTAAAITDAHASCIWPTATSWSMTRRTRFSPPSRTPGIRLKAGRSSKVAKCISRSTRPSPRMSGASGCSRSIPPDFFDLIIVDECHRGSARDESSWRVILEYFEPAYQLGMTATPLRDDNRDTYRYFGNPIYEYSLRQGIDDGFLAPYRVHRVITEWDAAGWRPSKDDVDRFGRAIPDEEYQTKDFERVVALTRTHQGDRDAPHRLSEEDRPLRQDHRLLRRSGTRQRNAAALSQPQQRPCGATIQTMWLASRPMRAISAGDISAGFRTSKPKRRDPHVIAAPHDRRRCADLQECRAGARRRIHERVQADHRARHAPSG